MALLASTKIVEKIQQFPTFWGGWDNDQAPYVRLSAIFPTFLAQTDVKADIKGGGGNLTSSLLLRKSQSLLFWLPKSSGHQSLPCLFDSRFLQMFRTTPIFGMSRDHNRKRGSFSKYNNTFCQNTALDKTKSLGMDWPHLAETRWTCSQEGTGVEPTGKAKERKTPAHLETYKNGGTGEEKSNME